MRERVSREDIIKFLIQDIIKCFEQRYGDMMDKVHEDAHNKVKETTGCYKTFVKSSAAKFDQTKLSMLKK